MWTVGRAEGEGNRKAQAIGHGYNNGNHWPRVNQDEKPGRSFGRQVGQYSPMMMLGRSIISRLIEKQNVQGTGAPFGFNNTQCETTD